MNRKVGRHTKAKIGSPTLITQAQVRLAISNSLLHNLTGPDSVNIWHLKHFGPIAIQRLTHLLKTSLNTHVDPHIWKLAKIIPIPKPSKDPCSGISFRPISLHSPIAKVLEKIIFPHFMQNISWNIHYLMNKLHQTMVGPTKHNH